MKISKGRLREIINEEVARLNKPAVREDVASEEKITELAVALGGNLVGQPKVAADVRDALAQRYPSAAKAFYSAFSEAQAHLDMVYSSYDQ